MTKEDIKKAAEEYAKEACRPLWRAGYEQVCRADFMEGAKWRINSVWHDATEKPKLGELIIVEVYGKIWEYGKSDVCDTNHPAARWAYMKDLIPNMEE